MPVQLCCFQDYTPAGGLLASKLGSHVLVRGQTLWYHCIFLFGVLARVFPHFDALIYEPALVLPEMVLSSHTVLRCMQIEFLDLQLLYACQAGGLHSSGP